MENAVHLHYYEAGTPVAAVGCVLGAPAPPVCPPVCPPAWPPAGLASSGCCVDEYE